VGLLALFVSFQDGSKPNHIVFIVVSTQCIDSSLQRIGSWQLARFDLLRWAKSLNISLNFDWLPILRTQVVHYVLVKCLCFDFNRIEDALELAILLLNPTQTWHRNAVNWLWDASGPDWNQRKQQWNANFVTDFLQKFFSERNWLAGFGWMISDDRLGDNLRLRLGAAKRNWILISVDYVWLFNLYVNAFGYLNYVSWSC
jgi:hypothetical protein